MIIDRIQSSDNYASCHPLFDKAFDFLKEAVINGLNLDRYDLEGDRLFALIQKYETREASECLPEAHKEYIDIQYILKGEEIIGVSHRQDLPVEVPYNPDSDILFYKNIPDSPILLKEGDFTVFFPGESHKPGCHPSGVPEEVTKIVLKIKA